VITELRLVSNNGASTARFWSAIFNVRAEQIGPDRWRVTSLGGFGVRIEQARVVEAITRVDVEVACDPGAPDRLRAAGFPVSSPGFPLNAEDLNGTDGTVFLRVVGWDGVSDVDWEEPVTAITGHMVKIETDAVDQVAGFLAAWFDIEPEALPSGVTRFPVGTLLYRVEPTAEPRRQWTPLGARDYAEAVERCASAGFTVTPSPTHPTTAGHVNIGNVTFLLMARGGDAYYEQFSAAVEAGDYEAVGPLELRGEDPQ
jgi:hypothetical protein